MYGLYILSVIVASLIYYVCILRRKFTYWKRKGVVGPAPLPLVGNYLLILLKKKTESDYFRELYEEYSDENFIGIYKGVHPVLLIKDTETINTVLIKDFPQFRAKWVDQINARFTNNIFVVEGNNHWRWLRQLITPFFTTAKFRKIIPMINTSCTHFKEFIRKQIGNEMDIELRSMGNKVMMDASGRVTFGIELDAFANESEFLKITTILMAPNVQHSILYTLQLTFPKFLESVLPLISLSFHSAYRRFHKFVIAMLFGREIKTEPRDDLMDYLIDLKETKKLKNQGNNIGNDVVTDILFHYAGTIYLGAFEGPSGGFSFIIYELAQNQDVQQKCYDEIVKILKRHDGKFSLDALYDMKYLEMISSETQRKYSQINAIERQCVASSYTFPGSNLTIDKGVFVFVPIHGLHFDPKYFPNPERFDPERFSPEKIGKIPRCAYLPFGEGPRMCIGMRYSKLLMMMTVATFIHEYKVLPSEKTTNIKFDPDRFRSFTALGGLWVNVRPRNMKSDAIKV